KDAQAQRQNPGAKTPQPAQQQADVVTSATQHCVHRISQGSLEPVAPELTVSFHVPDSRLDSATPLYHRLQPARHAARSNPPRLAAATVAASNSSTPASPKRLRKRVRLDGSIGGSVCKYVSPVNTCQYGFSTQPHTTSSSERSNACCRYSKPAINRGDVAGRPRCE